MPQETIDKARRHQALLSILREEEIGSQEVLRRALKRRGFPVTQGTLSRDLKELRVPCVPTGHGYRYAVNEPEGTPEAPVAPAPRRMRSVAALEVTGIDANEVCVIVRTLAGRAPGVAVYIDGLRLPDIMATLAGDDTIVVFPGSVRRTARVLDELSDLLGLADRARSPIRRIPRSRLRGPRLHARKAAP